MYHNNMREFSSDVNQVLVKIITPIIKSILIERL